jgi:nucleoside-diphosphate-sugar epimerase
VATLVTGLGYIGSALAECLLADGDEVVGLENFFSTPAQPIEKLAQHERFHPIEGSVADPTAVERALAAAPIETVFHLAAQASTHPDAAPTGYTVETNYGGPRVLLAACVAHGVRRVVFASSTRLYRLPLPRRLTERSPLGPTDLVHLSHLYGELLLTAYRTRGVSGAAARIGIVHGVSPVMKTDPRFLAVPQRFCLQAARSEPLRAATGASSHFAFVHVADAVQGLICLRDAPDDVEVANVTCEVLSVTEVASAVQNAGHARGLDVRIEYDGRPSGTRPREIETTLSTLGFKPERRFAEGVAAVLDHYLSAAR